jgi:hypothetical protein
MARLRILLVVIKASSSAHRTQHINIHFIMKKLILCIAFLLPVHFLIAQTLTEEERKFVVDILEANSKKFLADIEKVSEEQWKFKPGADRWSVGDVAEHITLSEDLLYSIVQKTLLDPADDAKAKGLEGKEKQLLVGVRDRSFKAQAPEVIKPMGKFASKKELVDAFIVARNKTIEYIKTTNDPLKNHVTPHPAFGDLTTYQWLVLLAGHADRHVAQLEEVKADSSFPKM